MPPSNSFSGGIAQASPWFSYQNRIFILMLRFFTSKCCIF